MSLRTLLDGFTEVRGAVKADGLGRVAESASGELPASDAPAAAAAVAELGAAGAAMGFARLELLLVKGAGTASVTAVRPDELVVARVDPSRGTAQLEKALQAWAGDGGAAVEQAAASATSATAPAPRVAAPPPSRPPPRGEGGARNGAARPAPAGDPWAALRRALMRGHLTDAAVRRQELSRAPSGEPPAGAEPVPPAELELALQTVLHGIGSVLAGDGLGGVRTLEPLAAESQANLSFRWLALYWTGRAATRSGNAAAARASLKDALALARRIDLAALSATQWAAAELLAHAANGKEALAFLAHARAGFERLADAWGLAQTWLAEARLLASLGREDEAAAAARQAATADPGLEEPALFLARRALARNDLDAADALLRAGPQGSGAARVRALLEAMRGRLVGPEDAAEFLREAEAPPSARSIRAMERIARAAPRFVQAREALAWMLLKVGKYADASTLFRGLLAQPLAQADRAAVMLGLGCIAHAQQAGKDPEVRLQAAVGVGGAAAAVRPASSVAPLPPPAGSSVGARGSQAASASVFSGQLGVFALPDVVEFVRSARRTGMLVCSSGTGLAALHFRDGKITHATSPGAPGLGELLLRARKISSVALRAVQGSGSSPDHALGEQLVREGLVDAADVHEALRRQIELAVLEVLRWRDGEFAFNREAEGDAAPAALPVEFDAQDVLLNVLRQLDEDGRAQPSAS